MQLSVIIPTLNEAEQIAGALEHAAALKPDEIIVADGGSTDGTLEIIQRRGITAVVGPAGRGQQLNQGARQASGDVLLFLHADTRLVPEGSEQMRQALANQLVVAGAFRQRIDANGWLYRLIERGNAFRAQHFGLPYGDQGIFVRRATFQKVGGFPNVPVMEDLILMRRLRQLARPVLLAGPLHVSARRWEKNGVFRQTARNWSLLVAERLGTPPERLAAWYQPYQNRPVQPDCPIPPVPPIVGSVQLPDEKD